MQYNDALYQQLLEDQRFVRWATGEAPQDDEHWKNWAREDSSRLDTMELARQTLLAIQGGPVDLSQADIDYQIQRALYTAKQREIQTHIPVGREHRLARFNWVAAASLLLLLGFGWSGYLNRTTLTRSLSVKKTQPTTDPLLVSNRLQCVANTDRPARHVLLPDGSSVVLYRNSQVSYAFAFNGPRREVYLSGEAFFEVTKDPAKPFFVYADGLVTKVLGTSFTVKAHQQAEQVIVAVRTGKVAVFAQADPTADAIRTNLELTGLVLTPNQQATFERTNAHLSRTETDAPTGQPSFEFRATPAADVFAALEKAYGVTIRFDRDVMAHCSLSATLGDEPLQQKLQWICTILEATYQVKDQQISITGKPCQ